MLNAGSLSFTKRARVAAEGDALNSLDSTTPVRVTETFQSQNVLASRAAAGHILAKPAKFYSVPHVRWAERTTNWREAESCAAIR